MDTVNSPSQVGHELPNEEDLLNRSYYWIRRISMTQTLSKTMKAVAIDRFGGIETLETQELPIPAVGADEVLVHVEAAGVGVWDPFEREGGFAKEFNIKPVFPLVLGSDGAGTVEAVGSQVKRFKKGDRVYGISFLNPKGGFYAQYAVVKETSLALIPGKLTMPQAAAMAVDAVTALAGLDTTLGLKNGESLLIFGASGGIGHLAVQFAKRMGARVLAVASGDDGVAFVRGLGADEVVDGVDMACPVDLCFRFAEPALVGGLVFVLHDFPVLARNHQVRRLHPVEMPEHHFSGQDHGTRSRLMQAFSLTAATPLRRVLAIGCHADDIEIGSPSLRSICVIWRKLDVYPSQAEPRNS
jgi:hypothetical protein